MGVYGSFRFKSLWGLWGLFVKLLLPAAAAAAAVAFSSLQMRSAAPQGAGRRGVRSTELKTDSRSQMATDINMYVSKNGKG